MKLRLVALCSLGGCVALKYLKVIVDNKARVEGCIAEAFLLKELTDISSVYFVEEHNVNAPTMRYSVDAEPCFNGGHNYRVKSHYHTKKERCLLSSICIAIWKR
jgi:hypothetical protein